jgi:hypothetical protein
MNGHDGGVLISKLIFFEPQLDFDDVQVWERDRAPFDREIDSGNIGSALVTALKMSQMGPWLLRMLPVWMTAPVVNIAGRRAVQQQQNPQI